MLYKNKYLANLTKLERKLISFPLKVLYNSERKNTHQLEKDIRSDLELLDYLCALLEFLLISIQQKEGEHSKFEEAFIIHGTKILSHARSIRCILVKGWHGDAHSLISLLLCDTQMIMYLGYYPEYLDLWFSEQQDSYQKDDSFRKVVGKSMESTIRDGSYCIFRYDRGGSRNGKVVLVESRQVTDPETNQKFTIKRYRSEKESLEDDQWCHKKITLSPDNKEFKDIVLENVSEDDFKVVAEFIQVLK